MLIEPEDLLARGTGRTVNYHRMMKKMGIRHLRVLLITRFTSIGIACFYISCSGVFPAYDGSYGQSPRNESVYSIMGRGSTSGSQLAGFLRRYNPAVSSERAAYLANVYIEEAAFEGVNHDVAFSQMCLETGFLKYSGVIEAEQNNFGGLGAVDQANRGYHFSSVRLGIRAHIQHLKAYGSREPLNQELIYDRFHYVERGSAPTIFDLSKRWAVDPHYGQKVKSILDRLYASF